jgi:hypothetical protein
MAQTIAMQRGSVSGTSNGNWITIFTQSSGIATRVIPVNLEHWLSTNPSTNNGSWQLAVVSSSGGGQIISSTSQTNMQNFRGFQLTCCTNNAQDIAAVSTTAVMKTINWNVNTNQTPYNTSYSSVQINYGSTSQTPNPIGQFFMGNGDSLRFRCYAFYNAGKTSPNTTSNVNFSFVTITES